MKEHKLEVFTKDRTIKLNTNALFIGIPLLILAASILYIGSSNTAIKSAETTNIQLASPIVAPVTPLPVTKIVPKTNTVIPVTTPPVATPITTTPQVTFVDCAVEGVVVKLTQEDCSKRQADNILEINRKTIQMKADGERFRYCSGMYSSGSYDYTAYKNCLGN